MPVITNEAELMIALNEIVAEVMPSIQKNISDELDKNILQYVYFEDYYPNKYYYNKTGIPTFGFRKAFQWEDDPLSRAAISKILYYNWESMVSDPSTYLHGDPKHGDNREELADDLNVSGYDNGILGGKIRARYWDITMDDLLSGTIENWFKTQFASYGIIKT